MSEPTATAAAVAPRVLVRASERGPDLPSGHPYNPRSEVHGWLLSRMAGLGRIAVNLVWLPPGKESAVYHVHHREEEWLLVLDGRGVAEVGDGEHAIGPGDFLGFPPGVAHHLRNDSGANLTCLVGGEIIPDVDVADFPRLGRRLVRIGRRVAVYPLDAEVPLLPEGAELPEALGGATPPGPPPRVLVRSADRGEPRVYHHPENPRSEVHLTPLSRPAGLKRVAVGITRVPAGKESYVQHVHLHDEEWMYVLSGRAIAEIGDAETEIGPGDFLGFPASGPPHHVRAAPGEDLVYAQGGDAWSRHTIEIVDYPRLRRRKTFVGTRSAMTFPLDAALDAPR
ncbi:cupin domain-containing protein [Anaeromyxobacter oryzisoli]|uniref:cupin domain-containing protein n=1 Tax=Anaeromyxobacter oryzisoli TaxID=2925408 RepID=UPI001F56FEAA|nr:cupin domain-containing protein [Anaeromyxobacter sp. SG63]